MSRSPNISPQPQGSQTQGPEPLQLKDIGTLLVKHYGLHEGTWDVSFEMNVAIGQLGSSADKRLPGAMFMISRIGLIRAAALGPYTINAAEVNPGPAAR